MEEKWELRDMSIVLNIVVLDKHGTALFSLVGWDRERLGLIADVVAAGDV